jgi:uncharacterized Fe-S cluster-containing radical SAM superfamily protein
MIYKEPEENTFSTLIADITHRCNMKCANCYIPNRYIPDMDIQELYKFLKRLNNKPFIRLIGAEPTVRKDLPDIIKNVKDLGFKMSICSNGLKLADLDYCKTLQKSGLSVIHLSMNGADNDNWYKLIDNGNYAELKLAALDNILYLQYYVTISAIIVKSINENIVPGLVNLLVNTALKHDLNFNSSPWNKSRTRPTIRFRSVGKIGRYIDGEGYTADELLELVCSQLAIDKTKAFKTNCGVGYVSKTDSEDDYSWTIEYATEIGKIFIRMTSWESDESGIINAGNTFRGRITQDWKIAPFFEHVKANEFNY